MSDWPYRQLILSGTCPPSTKKYFSNNHVGISYGTVAISPGNAESAVQTLDIAKHPKNIRPTVILTPIGETANLNTYTYEITWMDNLGVWQWKAGSSAAGEIGVGWYINYQVMSTWA